MLSTTQLRLAYSTLVHSATMISTGVPGDTHTLAWYCVQLLVDTIRDLSPLSYYNSQKKTEADNNTTKKADDRSHRLSLMLISTISSLPMTILLRALDEIYIIIRAYSYSPSRRDDGGGVVDEDEGSQSETRRKERKKELLEALFSEILEKVGDCEKEAAMKWWYTYRPVLVSESGHHDDGGGGGGDGGNGQGPLGTILFSWFTKHWKGVEKVEGVDDSGDREKNQSSSNSLILSRL